MSKPRRKTRRHKHRGTQAGTIERPDARPQSRGRSGRTMTKEERRVESRRRRDERLDREPTWRSAFNRAALAAVIFAVLAGTVLGQEPLAAALLGVFMLVVYVPLGYGFDRAIYRMRMRRKAAAAGAGGGGRNGGRAR